MPQRTASNEPPALTRTSLRWALRASGVLLASLLLHGCGGSDTPPATTTTANTATPTAAPAAAPAVTAETAEAALSLANTAFRENRIVAPAGNNALEHALRALQLDANNAGATEILVDLTPIAASAIEAEIAAGNFAEAERVMGLLSSANASSLTVQSLQRRLADATRQAAVVAPVATPTPTPAAATTATPAASSARDVSANAVVAAPAATATAPAPTARSERPATTPATAGADTPTPATTTPAPRPTPVVAAAAPAEVIDPVPISKAAPEYPPAARKRRAEGWVELQFMVGIDGVPKQIEVTGAQPAGLFDRSAIRALSRWKFKPGSRDGQPVEARARTTINFKLS